MKSGKVLTNMQQSLTDEEKAQARTNIGVEEYRGNQFDIVQNHSGTGKYCKIAELTRGGDHRDSCFYYFTLCLKFVVNFDSSTESGIENGTFLFSAVDYDRLNDYEDNGQWLEYDNAFSYTGISQCIKGVHILRQKSGLKVARYEIWLEVDDTIFNKAGSISVNVIANVGSWAYNGQTSRSDRGMKAGWFEVYDATQASQPMLLQTTMDTLTDSTFVEATRKPRVAVIDNLAPLAEAKAIVQKGDIPFMNFGGAYAWPYAMIDSMQAWVFLNVNTLQVQKKVDGHCETVLRYMLYREERTNFTIEVTGESLLGKINDPSNWSNPNAPGLEIDMYRASASASDNYKMRAYWKKGDTSDPAPTKDFLIVVKVMFDNTNNYQTYTKTLSPTYTELRSFDTTSITHIREIEVEFKEPNNSHNYKLVCNMFFGQSRFIDMGSGY